MSAANVPAVYASALLELATENGRRQETVADAVAVAEVFAANPELAAGLVSPELSRDQGKALLREVFGGKIGPEVLDLLLLLVDRDRVEDLGSILGELGRIAAEEDGRHQVVITTAVEIDAANRSRLDELIRRRRGPNAIISYTVDPAIIGGLRIQGPERVVDFTARRHLSEMKRTMLLAPVAAAWEE